MTRRGVPGRAARDRQLLGARPRRPLDLRRPGGAAARSRSSTRSSDPDAVDPETEAQASEVKDRLADAIESLPERERLVVALYYYENLTLREIGEVLGVTESRVSQLHTKAVLGLRSRFVAAACPDGPGARHILLRMAHKPADRIRNVALIGHRGSGKTSLAEALLFEAGVVNRLGQVEDGSTVCDFEDDEQERAMSIGAAVTSFEYDGRKINLIDTPGEPSFVADTLGALRVVDAAVFVVNARDGRRGPHRAPLAARRRGGPGAARVRQHARPRARRLLPLARLAEGGLRPARGRDRDPDRRPSTRCAASST